MMSPSRITKYSALLLLVFLISVSGCGGDSGGADDLVGSGGDDNGNQSGPISFSQDVAPIFQATCAGSGCHINNTKNGVNLSSHAQVTASRGDKYATFIVVAGNATASPLIDKLGSNPQFGDRMPDGKSALSSSQISTIRTWINDGALNN